MTHKNCGGKLVPHLTKTKWVIARHLSGSDHPASSIYSEPDVLVRCESCKLIGVESKKAITRYCHRCGKIHAVGWCNG